MRRANPADTVVLRDLYLTGLGATYGIFFQTGRTLQVESVVASGFDYGLVATAAGELFVTDSRFRRNVWDGVYVFGGGRVEIADSRADLNGRTGFFLSSGAARGSIERSAATRNVGADSSSGAAPRSPCRAPSPTATAPPASTSRIPGRA